MVRRIELSSSSILNTAKIEDRFIRIGYSSVHRLLLVVFCERADGDVIRVISARQASAKERWQYEEGI